MRSQYLAQFDQEYVDNAIVPHFLNRVLDGERPVLPMINVALTKEDALPYVTQEIVYDNYMTVRKNLDFLKKWVDDRLADLSSGKTPAPGRVRSVALPNSPQRRGRRGQDPPDGPGELPVRPEGVV